MAPKRNNRIILYTFYVISSTVAFPAMAQQVIDSGQNVQVPGDYSSPWNAGSSLSVGQTGKGTLTVSNGGTVTNVLGTIGEFAGSEGRVTVTGPGSAWSNMLPLSVGLGGKGELNINNGGLVSAEEVAIGVNAGASGTVNVGLNSLLQSEADLNIGIGGQGALNIIDGGQVSARIGAVGLAPGSSGSVQVDGSGSRLTISDPFGDNNLSVGGAGSGSLTVSNGGKVDNLNGYLGYFAGANGTALVTGAGATWKNGRALTVGREGKGTLIITDGGIVTNVLGTIGEFAGSEGRVTVTGLGSAWSNMLPLSVGQSGKGELNINNGGLVSAEEVSIGVNAGASGTVNVGLNSLLQSEADLNVGIGGQGALNIIDGGQVSARIGAVGLAPGSSGSVQVDGSGSRLTISDPFGDNNLSVGGAGSGSLTVSNGGKVDNLNGYLGYFAGANGTALVTGTGATWKNGRALTVGREGKGTLIIADGGIVTNVLGTIGEFAGSDGRVTVTGPGSAWSNMLPLSVGQSGKGELNINNGGFVSAEEVSIGVNAGASGTVNVGPSSLLQSEADLNIGIGGQGALNIIDGGQVSARIGSVGLAPGSRGSVRIDGAGSALTISDPQGDDDLIVGASGRGSLTLAAGGQATAGKVYLAQLLGSTGVLSLGSTTGNNPVAPGTLVTSTAEFGDGDGSIVFNHNSSSYVFDASINGGANNKAGSGTGIVGNGLVDAVAGRTILNAEHGDFTGTLQASNSGILQVNGNMSTGTANILAGGRLEGNGTVGNTTNAGIVAPGASIGTLTIAGHYVGNNGVLEIESVLGGDASPADKLVVTGDASGSTTVKVTNLGGAGAQTRNGIQIIQVDGTSSSDVFTLSGDYKTEDGQQATIGGAYAYTLQPGGTVTAGDGNWYLVSNTAGGGARYHPGLPLYEQYSPTLAALNTLPTLQQRVGNRYWSPSALGNDVGHQAGWGRIEGTRMSAKPSSSDAQAQRDIDVWKLQTGFDYMQKETADGLLVGGLNFVYGSASSTISSPFGRGKIDTTGTGLGTTLTWYDNNGFYVDGQAQVMWFDSDISSSTLDRNLNNDNDGNGYALSSEVGKRYPLNDSLTLTPQAQLVWSHVEFDRFTDPFGTQVTSDDGDNLRMRVGLSLDHEQHWTAANGKVSRVHLFTVANLYNEFLDGTQVSVAETAFRTRDDRLWAGAGVGGSYEWDDGRYAVYGTADVSNSLEHMNGNYALGGTLGVRITW